MIERIGFVALGHSAVADEASAVVSGLSRPVQVVQRGALDGLTMEDIRALAPGEGEKLLICKVEPGQEASISYQRVLPLVQDCVDWLESEGAELIAVLCGSDWAPVKSNRLLINPGAIMPQLVVALSRGLKLGVVLPTIDQVQTVERDYRGLGADVVATYATLGGVEDAIDETRRAAHFFVEQRVDLVWMPCMGMNREMQATMRSIVNRPVMLAQAMLARVIDEMIG